MGSNLTRSLALLLTQVGKRSLWFGKQEGSVREMTTQAILLTEVIARPRVGSDGEDVGTPTCRRQLGRTPGKEAWPGAVAHGASALHFRGKGSGTEGAKWAVLNHGRDRLGSHPTLPDNLGPLRGQPAIPRPLARESAKQLLCSSWSCLRQPLPAGAAGGPGSGQALPRALA